MPNFVTADEGRLLQQAARSEGGGGGGAWKDLHKRRLQIHGGTPHPSGMVEEELPLFLREGETEKELHVAQISERGGGGVGLEGVERRAVQYAL